MVSIGALLVDINEYVGEGKEVGMYKTVRRGKAAKKSVN